MSASTTTDLVTRYPDLLRPDPTRVITRLFVPGEEGPETRSRAAGLVRRVLALPENTVDTMLGQVIADFADRHRDFRGALEHHASLMSHHLVDPAALSPQRRLLLGAYFTHEYAVEAAALCNPSLIPHPDQSDLDEGQLRVAVSLRAIGEGHVSSIGFATGILGPGARVSWDPRTAPLTTARRQPDTWTRGWLRAALAHVDCNDEVTGAVLARLSEPFDREERDRVLASLDPWLLERPGVTATANQIRELTAAAYTVCFDADTDLSQRLLWPLGGGESHGMEDARFVQFTGNDGDVGYLATYTAYDGTSIAPRLLESPDLRSFHASALTGPAARNKGMALFPRPIRGRHHALCRGDGETLSLATSADGLSWADEVRVHAPDEAWELLQVGNCGSPLETAAGWLVLTHGVGPLRTYAIGALLLDLDDPTRVLATLPSPLLSPDASERDGYVPNVLYSCGGMIHDGLLWLPYGISDARIGFASVPVDALLAQLVAR